MHSVFIETTECIYLITSNNVTDLLTDITNDIMECDSLDLIQMHATTNNVFDEALESKLHTFFSSLKSEKENQCNQ